MNYEIVIAAIGGAVAAILVKASLRSIRHVFIINEGFAGLLYHKGKFREQLAPGRYVRWGWHFTLNPVDLRKGSLPVVGQELLTADSVALKLSVLIGYQVSDPAKAMHETQSWGADLYNSTQLALRSVVNGASVETLLGQRLEIGSQLLARIQPDAAKTGLLVHTAEVKDVMFAAELKRAFADVLKAKQEGQAALERARGESAALRNLANAARLLEGNPALMNLRLIQSVSAAQANGNTLVLGLPGGFVPLNNGRPSPGPHTGEGEAG